MNFLARTVAALVEASLIVIGFYSQVIMSVEDLILNRNIDITGN